MAIHDEETGIYLSLTIVEYFCAIVPVQFTNNSYKLVDLLFPNSVGRVII